MEQRTTVNLTKMSKGYEHASEAKSIAWIWHVTTILEGDDRERREDKKMNQNSTNSYYFAFIIAQRIKDQ